MGSQLNGALSSSPTQGLRRVEVLNFGAESWTSVESLINYSVRGVHADLDAIVVYHAINDVVSASHPSDFSPEPDYSHWRTRLDEPPISFMNRVSLRLDRFRLIGLVRYLVYKPRARTAWTTAMRNYPFDSSQAFQGTETFRFNLNSIISVALGNGTKVFLVTQVHSPELSREVCGNDVGIERTELMNQVVRDLAGRYAASGDVVLVDAAARASELGLLDEMTDWCHFTKEGYASLGQFIGQSILEHL
jgi:hypothetical protein